MFKTRKPLIVAIAFVGAAGLLAATFANADDKKATLTKAAPEMKLPPGVNPEDMAACTAAGTPGKMHEHLAKSVGTWVGKNSMWMSPEMTEPMKSDCITTVTSIMGGRFNMIDCEGEMPGMGPFKGHGIAGFDNVSQKFVGTWIDNCGTGIMNGTGELSKDGKTLTWLYTANCPITKKPTTMRQVETYNGDSMTLTMYANEPHSGKEYKCMQIDYTKKK